MTLTVQRQMQTAIHNAQGAALYFLGKRNPDGCIESVRVISRAGPRAAMMLYSLPQHGEVVLHNHPTGNLHPDDTDDQIARRLDGKGVGFFLINNQLDELYPLLEPFHDDQEPTPLDEEEMATLLSHDGPIAASLEHYEERPEQIELLQRIARAFNHDQVLMAEAGTGTGKSLAYLLPAIYWAKQNRERILLSTNTINLQEQIFLKDIPFLQKILKEPFDAVLVKGRRNYLCLRKLHQQGAEHSLLDDPQDRETLHHLVQWARHTDSGDRSELKIFPKAHLWATLSADADTCQRNRCEYYNSCFYYIARRKQAKADLLITNHHIFFADLALREATNNYQAAALLPPYQRIVLDEAHNIEDAASSFLGFQMTRTGVTRALAMLLKTNRRKEEIGLLIQLAQTLHNNTRFISKAESLRRNILEEIIPAVREQRQNALRYSEKIHLLLFSSSGPTREQIQKIRITQQLIEQGPWDALRQLGLQWAAELKSLAQDLIRLGAKLEEETKQLEKQYAGPLMDLTGAINRLGSSASTLELFFHLDDPEENPENPESPLVRWFELKPHDPSTFKIQAAPLEISDAMERMVYDNFGSVIFTSATLTTGKDDFQYIAKRLGIDRMPQTRVSTACYASPFDYASQAVIGIPTDIPNPKAASFNAEIADLIFQALKISDGRAFVLCTSFKLLTFLYEQLRDRLQQLNIPSLCQGKQQRHVLLQQKKRTPRSVLFGTDSFWEGVDVKGDALNNVILTRLPFRVPSEPLIEARMEAIEARGGNAFLEYTVPAATIKFKQGFGRLIRSRHDSGTVLILDNRVVEKTYGTQFLAALPHESPRVIAPKQHVLDAFSKHYATVQKNNP